MTATSETIEMTYEQWCAEGTRRFGPDRSTWRFVCPLCGHVASTSDWKDAGASSGSVGFACIGRWMNEARSGLYEEGPGPCDYTGGGFLKFNPVHVTKDGELYELFAFAEAS